MASDTAAVFHGGVLLGKFAVLFALLVFAFLNVDSVHLTKNPKAFLTQSTLAGASALVSALMLGINRRTNWKHLLDVMFLLFFMSFVYNVASELAGNNDSGSDAGHVHEFPVPVSFISKLMNGIMLASAASMTIYLIVSKKNDFSFVKHKGKVAGLLEAIAFGLINGAPAALAKINRGYSTNSAIKKAAIKSSIYFGFYWLLEGGGFFTKELHYDPHSLHKHHE